MILSIPPLSSGGIILSYQCNSRCKHCLYASSPAWKEWMSNEQVEKVFLELKKHNQYMTGIHLAGGEPFLNLDLLTFAVKKGVQLGIPIAYVETNGFWCTNDAKTEKNYNILRDAGLNAVLVSCSPFHLEFIPPERVIRAIRIGRKIFGRNRIIIYTDYFFQQYQQIDPTYPVPLDDYLDAVGYERASMAFATEYSLIPNGRAAKNLKELYERKSADYFFRETCVRELSSPHHIHIDLYGHYIAGLCAGISLGNGFNLDTLYSGIDLEAKPILKKLVEGGVEALYHWVVDCFAYKEDQSGYIAKCHLCLDIRQHLIQSGEEFTELAPRFFYQNLD